MLSYREPLSAHLDYLRGAHCLATLQEIARLHGRPRPRVEELVLPIPRYVLCADENQLDQARMCWDGRELLATSGTMRCDHRR